MTTARAALATTLAVLVGLVLVLVLAVPGQASTTEESGTAGDPPLGALAVGGGLGLAVLVGAVLLARRRGDDDLPPR